MKHFTYISCIASAVIALLMTGCIKNDIPYPREKVEFLSIEAIGQNAAATIDNNTKTVTLHFAEDVDIRAARIANYTITEGAEVVSPDLSMPLDLRNPINVTLFKYYDYDWTLEAMQPIERYFRVEGEIGSSTIDVPAHRVVAYVGEGSDRSALKVEAIKLGPENETVMAPNLSNRTYNFTQPVEVIVSYFGQTETWTIYVEVTETKVNLSRVNAWTGVIWAYADGQSDCENGFEYRAQGSEEWIKVPDNKVTHNGGSFYCHIDNLQETTTYEVRAYSGEDYTPEKAVTTEAKFTIPNMMLNEWWLDGKIWCPWAEGSVSFWDTGNKGSATLGESNSVPGDEIWNGQPGRCAMLQTKFVGIAGIGKLAAGNIFTGQFMKVDGTNGILNFGRPFKGRPTRLHGYIKYTTAPINYSSSEYKYLIGQPDTASIYMALTDWNEPYEIRTRPANRQLFDPNSSAVIAYGQLNYGYNIPGWTEFTLELNYRDTERVPNYVLIVASASKYGDFFTGGAGACLWVSNLWLDWTY